MGGGGLRRGGRCGGLRNHSEGEWLTSGAAAEKWRGGGGSFWGSGERGRREMSLQSLSHSEGKGWAEKWCC